MGVRADRQVSGLAESDLGETPQGHVAVLGLQRVGEGRHGRVQRNPAALLRCSVGGGLKGYLDGVTGSQGKQDRERQKGEHGRRRTGVAGSRIA